MKQANGIFNFFILDNLCMIENGVRTIYKATPVQQQIITSTYNYGQPIKVMYNSNKQITSILI